MADAFMNYYDKKFKPVLQNIPAQRDRSTQTAGIQDGGIQDLELCRELGLANALRPTTVKTDEQHLDRGVINLTCNKNGERTGVLSCPCAGGRSWRNDNKDNHIVGGLIVYQGVVQ